VKPLFLITIDTEGDDIWARPRTITTENARYLPRFQTLCERYGMRPTYLTNYEMASSPLFVRFGREVIARKTAEIGMHLHAWNSPPLVPLTDDDFVHQPYLIEYSDEVMQQKLAFMTDLLQDRFSVPMRSHRAGRWGLDARYASWLSAHGYVVDCSVTPGISWRDSKGDPKGQGGPDYRNFSDRPYFMALDDIRRAGASPLLELPLTVAQKRTLPLVRRLRGLLSGRARYYLDRLLPEYVGFFPGRRNLGRMLALFDQAERTGYVELALHSSELMPAGSPAFPDGPTIEALYVTLEKIFAAAAPRFVGATLSEAHDQFSRRD
jgi:hypothetical protein